MIRTVSLFLMPEASSKKKVVYLFGAGATHAELVNAEPTASEKQEERGLLMSNVSTRVIERARRDSDYMRGLETVTGTSGSLNIELLISLIENSKIDGWESKTRKLKQFVQEDIERILTPDLTARFQLHRALFELHSHDAAIQQEQLLGVVSLNYDNVLDEAYEAVLKQTPNYCLSLDRKAPSSENIPLLKLHGSFSWMKGVAIRNVTKKVEIIPLGSTKNYLHAPYEFIWSQALETLTECDILRVVGCSLGQNDLHLVDLLFKANLEKTEPLVMEIVDFEDAGDRIQKNYGFFARIDRLSQIEGGRVTELNTLNPFKTWLKYKADGMLKGAVDTTQHLREVYN